MNTEQKGNVLLVIVIGVLISITLFLAMFITSQRASFSKQYLNLQIPPIAIPTPPPLPKRTIITPIISPSPIETEEETTPSAEFNLSTSESSSVSIFLENNSE